MKKMLIAICLLVGIVLVQGCVSEAYKPSIINNREYAKPFDTVWGRLIQVITEQNYMIGAIEKDSGILSTSFELHSQNLGPLSTIQNEIKRLAIVPSNPLAIWGDMTCQINIVVSHETVDTTKVTVNTSIKAYDRNYSGSWHICYSRGIIEQNILDSIESKLSQ